MRRKDKISPAHAEALALARRIAELRKMLEMERAGRLSSKWNLTASELRLMEAGGEVYSLADNLAILRAVRSAAEFMERYGESYERQGKGI